VYDPFLFIGWISSFSSKSNKEMVNEKNIVFDVNDIFDVGYPAVWERKSGK
jgi:hypothetical protein